MVLAHKTSQELLDRAGKEMLAAEIMRESVRPMGIYIDLPTKEPEHSADAASEDEEPPKRKKASKAKQAVNPVQHVHFSNFIIQ
jgi:flagellar FliL protein